MNEKEKYIIKFIYRILTDNRYCTTRYGNLVENKTVSLGDCISYLENKYLDLESEE